MICKRCGNTVPEGQPACGCFVFVAEQEAFNLALARFYDGRAPIYKDKRGHLFFSAENHQHKKLCDNKSAVVMNSTMLNHHQLETAKHDPKPCPACLARLKRVEASA